MSTPTPFAAGSQPRDLVTVATQLTQRRERLEGIDATRTSSPCGLCLDAGTTILVSRPPHDDAGYPQGTLWIAHHEFDACWTCDDARAVEQLAQQLTHALEQERIRRMQAEAAARETARALLFKNAMIDEVNHRTKNTLQAASALLAMQANATSSAEVRRALLDSQARLQLLAQVHASLCIESNDTQSVFMPRLLQAVCDALARSFGQTRPSVRLEVSCAPISLPADEASAIALLSNEVVTNSYKHAFENQSSGKITVQLHSPAEQALVLRISDTGTGTGANPMNSKHGMGLKLMRLLAAQVGGLLDVASPAAEGGTTVTLKLDRAADCDRVSEPVVRPTPAAATAS